jgi:REP element-mobilizing transposase RayT
MPEYRRAYLPGSSVFLTLITYQRDKLFLLPENIDVCGRCPPYISTFLSQAK